MPTTKPAHVDQFEYDTALLPHQQIADDALDVISSIIEARDAANEMLAYLAHMQTMLEHGAQAYATREKFAVDLDQIADRIHLAVNGLLD